MKLEIAICSGSFLISSFVFFFFFLLIFERLQQKGIRTVLLSGDREEAVAATAKTVGVEDKFVNGSLTPQQKSGVISSLQASGHRVAMVIIYLIVVATIDSWFNCFYCFSQTENHMHHFHEVLFLASTRYYIISQVFDKLEGGLTCIL